MKVSIIIPTLNRYNLAKYALQSVFNQNSYSNDNIETILIDNCSNDETQKLCSYHKSLKYYRNESVLGICDNWYEGYKRATGEYMLVLGDDDYLFPTWYEEFKSAVELNNFPSFVGWKEVTFLKRNPMLGWSNILISRKAYSKKIYNVHPNSLSRNYLGLTGGLDFSPHPSMFAFKMSEIRDIEKTTNSKWFQGLYPDYHAGVLSSLFKSQGLIIDSPLVCIGGVEQTFYCRAKSKMTAFKGQINSITLPAIYDIEDSPYLDFNIARQLHYSCTFVGKDFDLKNFLEQRSKSIAENILFCHGLFGSHLDDLDTLKRIVNRYIYIQSVKHARKHLLRSKINRLFISLFGQKLSSFMRNFLAKSFIYTPLGSNADIREAVVYFSKKQDGA